MALLTISIPVSDPIEVAAALEAAGDAGRAGAAMVEWRVDDLAGSDSGPRAAAELVASSPLPCILTCRHVREGGRFEGPEEDRVALFTGVREAGVLPRYLDLEADCWFESAALRKAVTRMRSEGDCGLILSSHDFSGRPNDLARSLEAMWSEATVSVVKIAWRSRSIRDAVESAAILREAPGPMIALGMERFGVMTRILASKFGGLLTFAASSATSTTAPGQLTLDTLRETYRFDAIGPATKVYGIVGDPIEHSMSPGVHNAGFTAVGHDGVLVPMPVVAGWESFKASVSTLLDQEGFDLAGLCVTHPHKAHLLRFVREAGGSVSTTAQRVGAANTLTVDPDGTLTADNTDVRGVRLPLERHGDVRDRNVAVLGAGGAARAAAVAVLEAGAEVEIINRNPDRAVTLVDELRSTIGSGARVAAGTLRHDESTPYDVIINTTPVGMAGGPDPEASPWSRLGGSRSALGPARTVFDMVYAPRETPLIRDAREAGATVITGDEMFLAQAAAQFKRWTGSPPPLEQWIRLLA